MLIGLRLGRGPPGLGLVSSVKSSQESLWRIPAVPGGPAALNLASHFSILSAGFVVVTPLQVTQMAILRRPAAQTPDLLHSLGAVDNISLLSSLNLNLPPDAFILQRPRRYHDERDCARLLTDNTQLNAPSVHHCRCSSYMLPDPCPGRNTRSASLHPRLSSSLTRLVSTLPLLVCRIALPI